MRLSNGEWGHTSSRKIALGTTTWYKAPKNRGEPSAQLIHELRADPNSSTRIADIENVEIVFKDGVGYDTKKLLDSVKGHYGEY
jgi:hypothetical protein